jgi:hypothetical protein
MELPPNGPVKVDLKADLTKPIVDLSNLVVRASGFVGKLMGPPLSTIGGTLDDQFRYWRALNIERLREKWERRRAIRGLSPTEIRTLPFEIGARLIEGATLESDDEVQELWAALLDAATDPHSNINVRRVHVEILKSITSVEVSILNYYLAPSPNAPLKRFSIEDRGVALQNLRRHQCIRLKLNEHLIQEIDQVDDVLAHGQNVEKERLKSVIMALGNLIKDLSGTNDFDYFHRSCRNSDDRDWMPEDEFELTELGYDLLGICMPSAEAR